MNQQGLDQIQVDTENMYREESFTDLKVASIRRLIPIKTDGSEDDSRPAIYTGSAQIMSQMGPVPVSTQIEAASLEEALQKFPDAIKDAIEMSFSPCFFLNCNNSLKRAMDPSSFRISQITPLG